MTVSMLALPERSTAIALATSPPRLGDAAAPGLAPGGFSDAIAAALAPQPAQAMAAGSPDMRADPSADARAARSVIVLATAMPAPRAAANITRADLQQGLLGPAVALPTPAPETPATPGIAANSPLIAGTAPLASQQASAAAAAPALVAQNAPPAPPAADTVPARVFSPIPAAPIDRVQHQVTTALPETAANSTAARDRGPDRTRQQVSDTRAAIMADPADAAIQMAAAMASPVVTLAATTAAPEPEPSTAASMGQSAAPPTALPADPALAPAAVPAMAYPAAAMPAMAAATASTAAPPPIPASTGSAAIPAPIGAPRPTFAPPRAGPRDRPPVPLVGSIEAAPAAHEPRSPTPATAEVRPAAGPTVAETMALPASTPASTPAATPAAPLAAMAPDSALQPAGQLVVERAAPSTSTDISRSDDKPAAQSADAPPADVAPLPYALAPLVVAASPTPATMMASEPTPAEIAAVSAPLPQAQALRPVPAAAPGADDSDEAAFAVAADQPAAALSKAGRTLAAANAPAEMQASATAEVFATATAAGPGRKPPAPAVRLHDAAAPGGPDMTPFAAGPAERATAAPVLAPAVAPTVLATQPARLAHDLGLAIARQVSADGNVLHIRVEPAELGRIDVRMSFDDSGNLRAIVGADSSVALDLLRRDSADLGRAMADAGVRADSQSFRFESRGDGRGSDGGSPRPPPQRFAGIDPDILPETPDPAQFKPLRWRGRVDILA